MGELYGRLGNYGLGLIALAAVAALVLAFTATVVRNAAVQNAAQP
jgi:MFS transporter, NNP family, nitrate/nitrite transporter